MTQSLLKKVLTMTKYAFYGLILTCTTATVLLSNNGTLAQRKSLNEIYVTIDVQDGSILDVFEDIEKSTGLSFAYNHVNLKQTDVISLTVSKQSLSVVLEEIARKTDLRFKRINDNIHVTRVEVTEKVAPIKIPEIISRVVTGKITASEDNSGMPGVNILVKGTTTGTTSDANGDYSIEVPDDNSILVFSFIGFKPQEVVIGAQTILNIALVSDVTSLSEIVVIGYGTQKKEDLTGSIASVNTSNLTKVPTNDFTKALQGQVAGVSVQGGGEPGAAPSIKIRGVSTFGDNTPLYIVDGVQTPINDLPTADIESIQVLKDASAAAIYGARAANGVVIVTTKRGKEGSIKLNYNVYGGVQKITRRYDVANREQYQMLVNEASANAGEAIKPANDPTSPYYVSDIDTDWQDEAFTTGKIQEHVLNLSGGSKNSTFYTSLNYFNQTGTVEGKGPAYKRLSMRVNSDHKIGRVKVGQSFIFSRADQDLMSFVHTGNILGYLVTAIPTIPVYDPAAPSGYGSASQTIHGSYTANAIGFNNTIDSQDERYRFVGNAYADVEIIEGLNYKISLGYERTDSRYVYFRPVDDFGWFYVNNIAKMEETRSSGYTGTIENTLTYHKTIGKHDFTVLAGQSALQAYGSNTHVNAQGFSEPYFKQLSQASDYTVTGGEAENRLSSYFGRITYSYNDKYLLQANIRRDGSSRFAPSNRFGNFPSISVGWKMHNENFMKSLTFINQLKLRGGYGILGRQEIGNYAYQAVISPYAHSVFSNQVALGSTKVDFVDPDIHWEEKVSTNVGIDLGLFNKITFTADYFVNDDRDLLVANPIPGSTGVYPWESPIVNGASFRNKGLELQLGYQDKVGDFNYSVGANLTTLKNEVTSLGYGGNPIYGYGNITKTEVGSEVGQLYGYVMQGIFQTQAEIDALNTASPIGRYQEALTSPGDIKFKDINGRDAEGKLTGQADGKIDDDDRTYLGSAIPKLYFGFNINLSYKGFDFTALAAGHSGNKVFNTMQAGVDCGCGWDNYSTRLLDRWTPDNTDTNVPRVVMYDPNKNGRAIERWLEDGSFLRITNIQLGYTVPKELISKIKMSNLRVYFTGQNLITITSYKGYDPDFGNNGLLDRAIDHGNYPNRPEGSYSGGLPNPKSFIMGLQVGF